jgi:periplasmic divalent cation tolerance protein
VTEDICEVVITAPDAAWLANFTHDLVADRLCAAAHNIAEIRSLYRWRGVIEDRAEARVALHTRRELVPAIVSRTVQLHPYQVPCVVAIPIVGANPEYQQWVLDETSEANDG